MVDCVPLPQMNDQQPSEKRQSTRIFCNVPVQLQTSDGGEFSATCLDVNHNGVGIECGRVLTVGQRVHLMVPGRGNATVPMLVIYRMDKHYGLSALGGFEEVLNLIPMQS